MTERASIFDVEEEEVDVSAFKPAAHSRRQNPAVLAAVRQTAEQRGFASREAAVGNVPPALPAAAPNFTAIPQESRLRRRRTGRDRQINIKTSDQVADQLYAMADAHGWCLGETLEHALEALAMRKATQ